MAPPKFSPREAEAVLVAGESFRLRRRKFDGEEAGFEHAMRLIDAAAVEVGVDRACDLFFAAEREYWMRRNRAAQVQKARQDRLGLGWGNHDHHTYRSSREHFPRLIAALEALGMVCRERFYAGREAGWGAQVLEQPNARIVVFASGRARSWERWDSGASCTAKRFSKPACTTWSASSTSMLRKNNWRRRASPR
jgi:hypothetical protein